MRAQFLQNDIVLYAEAFQGVPAFIRSRSVRVHGKTWSEMLVYYRRPELGFNEHNWVRRAFTLERDASLLPAPQARLYSEHNNCVIQ
eukprot:2210581-Pyramimonas_sp.AAC.1